MARSPHQSQRNLPPMEVGKSERNAASFRFSEQHGEAFRFSEQNPLATPESAQALAAEIFNEALKGTRIGAEVGLPRKVVAELLGVSQNLVDRWCNPNESAAPTEAQLLCLPWAFHLARHKVMNRRFGFWRALISRVFESVGDLAAVGLE